MATAQELFNLYTQRIANSDSNGVSTQKQAEAVQKAEAKKDRLSPYQLVTANAFAPETISEEQKVELDPLAYLRTYGLDDFNKHNAALADASRELFTDLSMERSTPEAVADTAIGVGSGAANILSGVGLLGLAAADAVTGSRIAPKAVDLLNQANEKVNSLKSQALQGRTTYTDALKEAYSQKADRDYEAKIANGENETIASLERIGSGFVNAIKAGSSNSMALQDLTANAVGSMMPIGQLGRLSKFMIGGLQGAEKVIAGAVEKNIAAGMTKEVAKEAAEKQFQHSLENHVTAATGYTTAGGVYQQASTEAAESLKNRTDLTDEQKLDMRHKAGLLAAAVAFPSALIAGKLVAPFEAAPLAPRTLTNLAQTMGKETAEEALDSLSEQLSSNLGIKTYVDPNKSMIAGVGENMGEGALGGFTSAGIVGAPGVAKNAVGSAGKAAAGIANNRDAAKDSEAISVVNGSSESALEQINASADISTEAKEASKQVIEQTQNIPTEVLSKTKEGSTVQQIVKANGTDIIATMKALTDIIKNSKDIANDTDAHEAIAAAQIIQGKVAALGQQLEKAGFEGNEELTKYYQAMERIFSRTQQLAGDEKVLTKLNEIRDSLHEKLSTDASKVSQQELGILADTVLNDIAGAIESGVDLDNLISAMVPMGSGDDRKINALQTAKAAVKALEDALGTNWYGSVQHAIAAENVSRSTRSVFIALNDHLQQLLNETRSGIDPTASIISLGKFAQGQMNKLAAIEFSSNQGSNRNVLPITYGRSTNRFKSSPGESVGAGNTDKQKEFMRQIAAEVNVAKSLYDALKDKASIKLPELDAEGAIWEDDNSFSKIAYETTTVAGKDGKSTFDAYNQVYDDGSPNLIRKKSSGPKVERKVGFNLSIKESKHHQKDQEKAKLATHFIGDGAEGSSTDIYRNDAESQGIPTNKKEGYTKDSVVFVSINGNRKNRKGIETIVDSLKAAIEAGATIVTDTEENANRSYNIGEREVADFLKNNGYTYKKSNNIGVWTKAEIKEETEEAAKDETGETTKETTKETETEEVTTGKAKELTKAEIINNIQNALKFSDITALVDSVISLSKVVSPKVAVAIGSYISSGMGVNTEREFSLGQERHNKYVEELKNKNPELSKVLDDFLKERDFSKILRGKERKADDIFADDDTAFKEYFSTMIEIINGNETQEYIGSIQAIIEDGTITTVDGNRVVKVNGKKLLKAAIDNSSSKLMPIWKLVYKLTPDNVSTYIGAFPSSFVRHAEGYPIFFSPLVNTSGKSRFIDPKTLVHEFFHNVTLTNGDSEYWEALKGLKEPLKKILDELHEDSFLHMYIKYAASSEKELGAVLATEAVYGEITNVLETKHTKELADKFKDILGKFIQAGINLFIRKSKDATESNIADLANAAFVDLAQRILTKDEVNKILENQEEQQLLPWITEDEADKILGNQEQQTTTSTTKVEPIVESISPESHKEIQNELTTTIGSSVDSSIRDTLLSWITFGEGNSVFMSAVNDIATVLPKIQKELDKLLGSEEVLFNINMIVELLVDKLNTRAKQWHTNASDTVKSNFNNRVSALKNGNVARIFPQDYSNLWTNSENGFGTHLANAMALVGIRWIMSPSKEQKVSTSFLASHLEGRLGEGLSKNDIPGSILNRFNGFFMEAGAVDTLNTLFQDVTGLRKKTKDNLPVSTEGLLDSIGTNIFISMVDAGMIIPYVATWNDSKSNYDIVPYTSTNQLGDGSFIVYKYNKAVDQTLVNNVTKVLDNIFDVAAANNGVVYTTENELPPVQKKQIKSKIGISKSQTEIIKKANSIIFRLNKGVQALYNALGFKKLDYLFGSKINGDIHEMYKNKLINRQHYESLKGKQQSVYSAFNSFLEYVALAKGKDESFGFRFAHAISKVHRLQQQGSLTTPQADKLIRALMAPGEAELDPTNDEHKELFYKAMAQAFGIKIAEDYDWKDKLNKMMATEEFSQAIELIKKYTKVGETAVSNAPPLDDSSAYEEYAEQNETAVDTKTESKPTPTPAKVSKESNELDILKPFLEEGPVGLLALHEYVKWLEAEKEGSKFKTTLPIEIDGKTNGPAGVIYMLNTVFDGSWFQNLTRVGVELGAKGAVSLMDLFNKTGTKLDDSYRHTANLLNKAIKEAKTEIKNNQNVIIDLVKRKNNLTKDDKDTVGLFKRTYLFSVMGRISPEIEVDENGDLIFGRSFVKNPITVTLYGSGDAGIAQKILGAMEELLYQKATEAIQSGDPEVIAATKKELSKILNDINLATSSFMINKDGGAKLVIKNTNTTVNDLFEFSIPSVLRKAFHEELTNNFVTRFLHTSIAKSVSESAINNTKQLATLASTLATLAGIQYNRRIKALYELKLKEAGLTLEDKIPYINILSRNDFEKIYNETIGVNPLLELEYGSLDATTKDMTSSDDTAGAKSIASTRGASTVQLAISAKLKLPQVGNPGVKAIPYSIIGGGDSATVIGAMATDSYEKTLAIFDGHDAQLDVAKNIGNAVNEANINAWSQNLYIVYRELLENTDAFFNVDNATAEELAGFSYALTETLYTRKEFNNLIAAIQNGNTQAREELISAVKDYLKTTTNSLNHKAVLTEAKNNVIQRIGISSDQYSGTGSPYFKKGEEAGDFASLSNEEKANVFNDMLAEEVNKINGANVTDTQISAQEFLKNLIKNKLTNANDRRLATGLLSLLGSTDLDIVITEDENTNAVQGPSKIFHNKESTKEILSNIIDRVIEDKLINIVLGSLNGTDQEQMANRMGYARLEAILTNLDQINISSIASPEAAFIINNFINDLKDIMGVTPSSLGGESITLKEAWEQLNKEMNEASPDTLGELQSRVANTMAHMIREILSEPTIRAIYGSLESVGSKPEMVSKDIKNQMKEIDSIFPKSDKAARTVINRLRKLFHITIKSIFGEDLYKRVFSIKNDVEYSVQLMTYVEPKNVKKPEPTKPKIKNKNKPIAEMTQGISDNQLKNIDESEVSAMVPLPSSMSANEKALAVLKHVLTKYPSLAPKGQATTEQIAKLSTLSNKVMQMVDNLPQELRAADFNYNSQEMDRLTETVLQHMIMLPHEPAKLAEIQKIHDSFMDKVEIYHLDKFGIGQLKFEFLKNGAKQYTNLDGNQVRLAIFAGMVQNDPDLAKLVDQLVTTEVKKVTNIDEFLRNKNDQFWDWFNNKFFLEGKGKLLPSEIVKELIKVKDKNIDDQSYYEQLGSKYNNIISSIDNKIANAIERTGEKLSKSQSPAVALFGQALDRKSHASIARGITRLTNTLPFGDAIRSLARDVLNQDNFMDAYAKLNKQAKNIYQAMRNSIKNDLPVDIVSSFENKLNNEEWKLLTDTLGSMDIGLFKADTAKTYIINKSRRAKRIKEIESILSNSHPVGWNDVQKKAKQLSSFMNTKIAGELLLPNAYAVGELATGTFIKRSDQYISDLDELITLYALEDMSNTNAAKLTKLIQDNPSGFNALISVMGGIRAGEHTFLNVRNKYNFRKDYLRQQLELGSDIKVENEKNGKFLLERGYTKVAEFSPPGSNEKLSYYFAPVTGKNAFSQGALQVVRYTAFGIDSITGEPRGNINGGIVRDAKEIARLIKSKNLIKEGYRPLFNHKGEIIALERLIDTDKVAKANFEKNLPILLGSQLARQYEEVGADNINNALIEKTFDHWNAEKISHKDEYINVLDSSQLSRTQQDALSLVPPHLKEVAESYFGKGVWMVRKDAVDVVFGHRMAGIGDFQSGISNWSPETQKLIRNAMVELLGEKGVAIALKGEEFWKNLATDAKDMIVIKSIIIPAFNALSNIIHLSMVGIPFAVIPNKIKYFVNEANILSDSLNREKHLRMELLKYSNEPAKVEVILSRIESLEEARKKLKIYPLYENGEFGSIEDVAEVNNLKSLKSDSVVSFLNKKLDQLPDTPKHVLKNVLLTKDSATYQFMRKFTMYGDFIARAIEYEYLLNNGVSKEEIDRRIKNEFVDYDSPLGRNRAWSESMGLTMFWNYKLRIMKSATRIAFDNPFRAVMLSLSPIDTPITDNIFGKLISGTLGYSIGPGMMARSVIMHPVLASTL